MIEENRQLVTMNRLSVRNNRLKFETAGNSPIILEEIHRIIKENQINKGKPEVVNMWPVGLANTRISTAYAKNLHGQCSPFIAQVVVPIN